MLPFDTLQKIHTNMWLQVSVFVKINAPVLHSNKNFRNNLEDIL